MNPVYESPIKPNSEPLQSNHLSTSHMPDTCSICLSPCQLESYKKIEINSSPTKDQKFLSAVCCKISELVERDADAKIVITKCNVSDILIYFCFILCW